jgi:ProP effector
MTTTPPFSELLATVADLFPRAFTVPQWEPHRPLKIGIGDDLRAVLSEVEVTILMRCYTSRLMYQRALMISGADRVDLDGNPCGQVEPGQANHARAKVKRLLQRQEQAARQQERP